LDLSKAKVIDQVNVAVGDKPVHKQYTPTGDNVCGWVEPLKKQTTHGLILSDSAANELRTPIMHVIAVGPDCKQIKPGDRVVFFYNPGMHKIVLEGKITYLINEKQVDGILEKECHA